MTPLVIDVRDASRGAGAKARGLAELMAAGFDVPDGFVVTSAALDAALEGTGRADEVRSLLSSLASGAPVDGGDTSARHIVPIGTKETREMSIAERLRAALSGLELPAEASTLIAGRLHEDGRWAVRSSGTREDTGDLSYAGQYLTRLNVATQDVVAAVLEVYRSTFADAALAYHVDHGIDPTASDFHVIVQEMVQADVSGVAFTVNPLTGADTEIVVEAAPGLGEDLVSGRVHASRTVHDWYEDRTVEVGSVLTDSERSAVVQIALAIQRHYGFPCDVEWAVADGRLWVLQARPITRIHHSAVTDQWTNADFKDGGVSSTVCTPYMWSLYDRIWERHLRRFLLDSKLLAPTRIRQLGRMFYGRPYWNLSVVKDAMAAAPGYRERQFDAELGIRITYQGDGDTTPITPRTLARIARVALRQRRIVARQRRTVRSIHEGLLETAASYDRWLALRQAQGPESGGIVEAVEPSGSARVEGPASSPVPELVEGFGEGSGGVEGSASGPVPELVEGFGEGSGGVEGSASGPVPELVEGWDVRQVWRQLVYQDYDRSEGTYFWQIFINTIHQSLTKDAVAKIVGEEGYFRLISGLDHVSHLRPFYDAWTLSRTVHADPAALTYWTTRSVAEITADLDAGSDSHHLAGVRDLVRRYGYHSVRELDVSHPDFDTDHAAVVTMVKDTVGLDDSYAPDADRGRLREAYEAELDRALGTVGPLRAKRFRRRIQQVRTMLWWREELRDVSTRFYHLIRLVTLRLADVLVAEGVLDRTDDVWFCRVTDLASADPSALRGIVARNRAYYESFRHYQPPNDIGQRFDRPPESSHGTGEITGVGASPGTVEGIARVIGGLDDIERLQPGDILVTRFTDTGWTGKFALIRGIVTEYGGILTHAAIVSREYGIPCIVACHNAMSAIPDGSRVRVNGSTGEVVLL